MTRRPDMKRRQHRLWMLPIAGMAIAAIVFPMASRGPTLILWNASASVPVGLYFVQPKASLHVGDLAVATLPTDTLRLAAERQYLPHDVLLIKPVAAVAGAEICRHGNEIYLDGVHAGNAQAVDRHHRPMPNWQGCRELASAEIFLMNPAVADSFDGRYFGPIPRRLVQGRAFPLLTFAQPPRTCRTFHPFIVQFWSRSHAPDRTVHAYPRPLYRHDPDPDVRPSHRPCPDK